MSREKMITFPPGEEPVGNTPFERFDNLMRRILAVPKKEIDRREAQYRKRRAKERSRRRST